MDLLSIMVMVYFGAIIVLAMVAFYLMSGE